MGNKCRFYVDVMALHREVTGSCLINIVKFPDGSTKKFLVDCGLFQEPEYLDLNKSLPFKAEDIDYVVVTHNHIDHVGRLPLLVRNGFHGRIITSRDTSILIGHALNDSFKILNQKAKLLNEPALYSEDDVKDTLSLVEGYPFEESIWLDENIKVTLFMNGHLQGAAIALFQISYRGSHNESYHYENINVLYTGDYKNRNMFFDVKPIPNWVCKLPLTVIQESTYGEMTSADVEEIFEKNILKGISESREIIIPVFSLGRSQEILFLLSKWQKEKKLDTNIPIYYDGKLGMRYTKHFLSGDLFIKEECRDFLPTNLMNVTSFEMRDQLLKSEGEKIILTTSGMGSYGPARIYLPSFLKKKNALIHFTGYQAEGTLGRRLFDCRNDDYVEIFGLKIKKSAEVKFTSEFSAHAKQDELLDFLKKFENLKLVLVNHGNISSKDTYSTIVGRQVNPNDVGILGDYYFRINGYGLVSPPKTTKFLL